MATTRNFCTYADSKYRAKLLAMHASLMAHNPESHLYILCLDDALLGLLRHLDLVSVSLIPFKEFLDPALASKRTTRTHIEWIWTMTPSLPLYVLKHYPEVGEIAYVDADEFVFSNLEPMYQEIGNADSMVIPHRFPPEREKTQSINGTFNVGVLWWRRTERAIGFLREWRVLALDWCHWWASDGRFAEQGYLDQLQEKYDAHILQHLGCNLAPWNMGRDDYNYTLVDGLPHINGQPLIFFHFHEFKVNNEFAHSFFRCNYARPAFVERHIYAPYEAMLREQIERIRPYVQGTR
jgi:hypothetical protein